MYLVQIGGKHYDYKTRTEACRAALAHIWFVNFPHRWEQDSENPSLSYISDDYAFVWKRHFDAFVAKFDKAMEASHVYKVEDVTISFIPEA